MALKHSWIGDLYMLFNDNSGDNAERFSKLDVLPIEDTGLPGSHKHNSTWVGFMSLYFPYPIEQKTEVFI